MMNRRSFLLILLLVVFAESSSDVTNHFQPKTQFTTAANITNSSLLGRDKRGSKFQLDESEIARQNQITKQIFAKYLERRLFPNRSTSQKIPTIEEILPKPTTTTKRPTRRGYPKRRYMGNQTSKRFTNFRRKQNEREQKVDLEVSDENDEQELPDEYEEVYPEEITEKTLNDDDFDGQEESLQSVESEQHDQYYEKIFNRDPSENEVDSDCPSCVDDTQYMNKWTMPLLKLGEKRYYLGIFFKANWFKATQYCRYHGMHLASISSQEENDRLEKHIRDFGLGHEHFWTSGTDLADEGTFFWMANGRPISFANWNAGEPNNFRYENGEEENCLELWNRDGKGLKWNDSPCSFETYFVCEVQSN